MKFAPIKYFDWLTESYPKIELDLSNSSTRSVNLKELGFALTDIELGPPGLGGNPELRSKISELYDVPEKNILLSPGSTMSNFGISAALLEPGDNVIVETPTYEPLLRIPEALGVEVLRIARRFENGFKVDVEELNELVNTKTKMIMITNYNNPTGIGLFENELKAILEIAADNNAYLLSDEVYREFGFENQPPPVYSVSSEWGITTDSMTKFYGLGGIRVGWAFCPEELVKKAENIIALTTLINSCVGEKVGIEVFERFELLRERTRALVTQNFPIMKQWLHKHRDVFEVIIQDQLNYCFPKVSPEIDVEELVTLMMEKYRILIAPGKFFGDEVKDHIRVGFAYFTKDDLINGLEQFTIALEQIIAN
jgi:aspartate/methionine/tyrosine aminotransferase